ncbi:MAG: phosphodiester glycosidase family protein [Paenibacillaceae bacterium]
MTVANHFTETYNTKLVHVIKADLDCVSVEKITSTTKSVVNSNMFGVNGTFFASGTSLLGIAIKNGLAVISGGLQSGQTCGISTKRGTMYHYSPSFGGSYLATDVVKDHTDTGASASQMKWAIGGYSLYPYRTYTSESQYLTDINGSGASISCTPAIANTENAYRLEPSSSTHRTAIGWNGTKIVLAVFEDATAYSVRQYMKNQGCNSLAIMLDGGGSSQMRYGIPTPGGLGTGTYDPKGENRQVYSMVAVNPSSWI